MILDNHFTKKKFRNNVVVSLTQILISSISLFFLYKFILNSLGVSQLGIWAIISTSISSLAILNYGFSGSLVKYVAKYAALHDYSKLSSLIETTIITIAIFCLILGAFGYFAFVSCIHFFIPKKEELKLALSVLPICIFTFYCSVISSSFQAALEGLNKIALKSWINIAITLTLLICSYTLIPIMGLRGLGYSYLISSSVGMISSWFFLRKALPFFPLIHFKWNKTIFKETLNYNVNFQLIAIFSLLNDPITKFILARFGGMELTGLYELVSKLIMQIRNIVIGINQTIVPFIANLKEKDPSQISSLYKTSFQYVFLICLLLFLPVFALGPLFSKWWFGYINVNFLFFLFAINIGWFINTLSGPAYFSNLGSGNMKWNTVSHISMGLLNLLLCFTFAHVFEPRLIILGWVISLSICSMLVIYKYNTENDINLNILLDYPFKKFLLLSLITTFTEYIIAINFVAINLPLYLISVIVYMILLAFFIYKHPIRKVIIDYCK